MAEPLKLTAELVPRTSWYNNMRSVFPKATWDRIRRQVYSDFNRRCGICQAEGKLSCHEIWEYDDQNHVQTLRGFVALCDWCHHVKHIGLAGILARRDELNFDKVVAHFMRVNECDKATFDKHYLHAMSQWAERSKHQWQVNLSAYEPMVERKPGL